MTALLPVFLQLNLLVLIWSSFDSSGLKEPRTLTPFSGRLGKGYNWSLTCTTGTALLPRLSNISIAVYPFLDARAVQSHHATGSPQGGRPSSQSQELTAYW